MGGLYSHPYHLPIRIIESLPITLASDLPDEFREIRGAIMPTGTPIASTKPLRGIPR